MPQNNLRQRFECILEPGQASGSKRRRIIKPPLINPGARGDARRLSRSPASPGAKAGKLNSADPAASSASSLSKEQLVAREENKELARQAMFPPGHAPTESAGPTPPMECDIVSIESVDSDDSVGARIKAL